MITHKSNTAIYHCQHQGCYKIFRSKFSLKRHEGIHYNKDPFICTICGKKFKVPQYLKEHSYCHTKEKLHICGINGCSKSFRHASDLSLHRRKHPEYKLRKYHYMIENKKSVEKNELIKTVVVFEIAKNIVSKKQCCTAMNYIESSKESSANENNKIDISLVTTPRINDELDIIYLAYLNSLNNMEAYPSVERPKLPNPTIF